MSGDKIYIRYEIERKGEEKKSFDIYLDRGTLNLAEKEKDNLPQWVELNYYKCPNCKLNSSNYKYCPVAVNIYSIVEEFKSDVSFEDVDVKIITEEREYVKSTKIQNVLGSLIGIYMVANECPIMRKLKPMLRFHLPFATLEETTYRAISMYLMGEYFKYKKGETPSFDLNNLLKIYEDIQLVNKSFASRLSDLKIEDANINGIIILNSFANYVAFSIKEDILDDFEMLFSTM